jgi:hypothetical protein
MYNAMSLSETSLIPLETRSIHKAKQTSANNVQETGLVLRCEHRPHPKKSCRYRFMLMLSKACDSIPELDDVGMRTAAAKMRT